MDKPLFDPVLMRSMKKWIIVCFLLFSLGATNRPVQQSVPSQAPTLSFTFDDGKTTAFCGYELKTWNEMILSALAGHDLKAILFVAGHNKRTVNGRYVLASWNNAGHRIANHSWNHPNFNSETVTLSQFKQELLLNDSLIRQYSNYMRCFRFPYLKEGNTTEKVNGFRDFMKQHRYRNGYVTIDASDWYIDLRLRNYLTANPGADVSRYRQFYINHIYEHALYYDSMAFALTGRHIHHSLLLHHNLVAGLFLNDLIVFFKQKGWNVIDADKAYEDEVYGTEPQILPAGESLVWAMAKQSGQFDHLLRYPAEGDQYEKALMDSLGL